MPDRNDLQPGAIRTTASKDAAGVSVAEGAVPEAAVASHGRRPPRPFTGRDLTTGSVPQHIFHLSWPQAVEGVLNVSYQMVDLVLAGLLPGGYRALAGVGIAQGFVQFGFMSRQGLDMSMRAMVSRAVGAGDLALANRVALQSLSLTVAYGFMMLLVGVFLTEVLLSAIGVSDAVRAETSLYLKVQFVGMLGTVVRMGSGATLQAAGDVMTPMKATTVTRAAHVALAPPLMFGWGLFPAMGLAGAGLAGVIAQSLGCAMNLYGLFSGN